MKYNAPNFSTRLSDTKAQLLSVYALKDLVPRVNSSLEQLEVIGTCWFPILSFLFNAKLDDFTDKDYPIPNSVSLTWVESMIAKRILSQRYVVGLLMYSEGTYSKPDVEANTNLDIDTLRGISVYTLERNSGLRGLSRRELVSGNEVN